MRNLKLNRAEFVRYAVNLNVPCTGGNQKRLPSTTIIAVVLASDRVVPASGVCCVLSVTVLSGLPETILSVCAP